MPARPRPEDFQSCLSETPQTVRTAAGPLEYADRGDGEPLLALHGTPGGWDQGLVAAEFMRANGFRVIAPSRPGYLGTPLDTGRTPEQQGDALAALLDTLGIDRIKVFAGSGGGPAGYLLAARHADRVVRLLQVDAVCLPGPKIPLARLSARDPALRLQLWLFRHAAVPMLTALFRRFGKDSPDEAARMAAAVAADPVRMAQLEAIFRSSMGWKRRREGFDNDFAPMPGPLPLATITCPTLIVHGRSDSAVPPANAEHAHASIAGSELYWMQGSHVAFFLEEAPTAQPYALDWLRQPHA